MLSGSTTKTIDKKSFAGSCVDVVTKDGREFRFTFFTFDKDNLADKVHERIKLFAFNEDVRNFFAFSYKRKFPTNGWEVYNDLKEWKRMGIDFDAKVNPH